MTIVLAMSLPTEKAKAVVKLLLELGATSSQADLNHFTAFHYVVATNNQDVLDVLLENDRPVALSVLNNIGSQMYGNDGDSPLTTAIQKGHKEMVSKLLSIGAKPTTDFDEWIKAYLAKNEYAKNNTPDQNQKLWRDSVCQPIIAAAAKEMGESVRDLLAHGADPGTLEKSVHRVIETPLNAAYQVSESLLDIVQKKLKALREWVFHSMLHIAMLTFSGLMNLQANNLEDSLAPLVVLIQKSPRSLRKRASTPKASTKGLMNTGPLYVITELRSKPIRKNTSRGRRLWNERRRRGSMRRRPLLPR